MRHLGGGEEAPSARCPPPPREGAGSDQRARSCPHCSPRFGASVLAAGEAERLCADVLLCCCAQRGPSPGHAAGLRPPGPRGVQSPAGGGCSRSGASCRKLHPLGARLIGKLLGIIC